MPKKKVFPKPRGQRYSTYSIEGHRVYFGKNVLRGADPTSFQPVGRDGYARDHNFYWYCGKKLVPNSKETKVKDLFLIAPTGVYLVGKLCKGVDPKTFKKLKSGFWADQKKGFRISFIKRPRGQTEATLEPINTNRPKDLKKLESNYITDGGSIWYAGDLKLKKLTKADPKSFRADGSYGISKTGVYSRHRLIRGAHIKSFRVDKSWDYFAIDKSRAYYDGLPIKGVDIKSFKVIKGSAYAKDKKQVYWQSYVVKLADPKTFRALSWNRGKDKDLTFYSEKTY